MKQYLLSIFQPDGAPPPPESLEPIMREVTTLAEEMKTAGAWVLSAGLAEAAASSVVRVRNGQRFVTDGPYIEGNEHIGGLVLIRAADTEEAVRWASRLATATTLPIEVRAVEHGGGPA